MNIDQLVAAADTLTQLSDRLTDLPENREDAVQAALHCSLAALILNELAHHLAHGAEPYEALRRTAVGELNLDPSKATVFNLVAKSMRLPKDGGTST